MQFPSSFFFFLYTPSQHPCGRIDMTTVLKKLYFISSDKSDYMIDNLSIVVHASACHTVISFSVDEILLLR